jgi:hypothetical protein
MGPWGFQCSAAIEEEVGTLEDCPAVAAAAAGKSPECGEANRRNAERGMEMANDGTERAWRD